MNFKGGIRSLFDHCVNAMGRRPYWPSCMEVSYRGFSCDVISSQFCKSSNSRPPCWFPFAWTGIGKYNKSLVTFYSVHITIIPNYDRVTRILKHTLGWNFKSCYKVNQKKKQVLSVRPQHSALPLILFVFIHDFASLTQFTHSFHFHAYLTSRSPICYFN